MAKMIAEELQAEGVLGRFSINFISVREPVGWKHYAIEINLRKGGTTHPFLMFQFLPEENLIGTKVYTQCQTGNSAATLHLIM
jgi:hypothetical protein